MYISNNKTIKVMRNLIIILALILSTSCAKETETCGIVEGGGYNSISNTYYLRVNNINEWVDEKTYESYYVGDMICLESW